MRSKLSLLANRVFRYGWILIILVGIVFRLDEFLKNYSLWSDEANTAYKLSCFPLWQLIQLEDSNYDLMHSYPVGFMLLVKGAVRFLGDHEMAFRFVPLAASIGSLFLFRRVAQIFLPTVWSLAALWLFAISPQVISYAASVKPYSLDILLGLTALFFVARALEGKEARKGFYFFVGALVVFFSFAAEIVLAAETIFLFGLAFRRKDHIMAHASINLVIGQLVGCIFYYYVSLRFFFQDHGLLGSFNQSFMPPGSLSSAGQWLIKAFAGMFENVLVLPASLAGVFFILGLFNLCKNKEAKRWFIIAPIMLTIVLAAMRRYPFGDRTSLFLSPMFFVIIASGCQQIFLFRPLSVMRHILTVVVLLLVVGPLPTTLAQFQTSHGPEEMRPVVEYLKGHQQAGDIFFVNNEAQYAFGYYNRKFAAAGESFSVIHVDDAVLRRRGRAVLAQMAEQIVIDQPNNCPRIIKTPIVFKEIDDPIEVGPSGRAWLILSHHTPELTRFIVARLETKYQKVSVYHQPGADLYLFQLKGAP